PAVDRSRQLQSRIHDARHAPAAPARRSSGMGAHAGLLGGKGRVSRHRPRRRRLRLRLIPGSGRDPPPLSALTLGSSGTTPRGVLRGRPSGLTPPCPARMLPAKEGPMEPRIAPTDATLGAVVTGLALA